MTCLESYYHYTLYEPSSVLTSERGQSPGEVRTPLTSPNNGSGARCLRHSLADIIIKGVFKEGKILRGINVRSSNSFTAVKVYIQHNLRIFCCFAYAASVGSCRAEFHIGLAMMSSLPKAETQRDQNNNTSDKYKLTPKV